MFDKAYVVVGLGIFVVLTLLPLAPVRFFLGRLLRDKELNRKRNVRNLIVSCIGAALIYAAVSFDAFWIEPNWPYVANVEIEGAVSKPLRILHASDLHVEEEAAARDEWLVAQVKRLAPDIVFITGDIHQINDLDVGRLKGVLSRIHAPLGVFACVGFDNTSVLHAAAPDINVLENESVVLEQGTGKIGVCGLYPISGREKAYERIAGADYRIVINHTPDLADEAVAHSADLYLCGHTHGGQVRIPFWGAIITLCETGKKYEAGFYHVGKTWIHTSKGLGLEPRPAPQVRFLCRPEITLITVNPAKKR